jgi:hypothetical protein
MTALPEEPKEIPTLLNFAEMEVTGKGKKDLEHEAIPALSKLEAALRLMALERESSSESAAPSEDVTWRMLRRDGVVGA